MSGMDRAAAVLPPDWILHLALGRVGVGVIGQAGGDDLVGEDIAFLNDLADVDVLHRVVVRPEAELATHAVELGRFQSCPEGVLIGDVGLSGRAQESSTVDDESMPRRPA